MESLFAVTGVLLLAAVLCFSWFLTLLGMPGNWLMVLSTGVFALLIPAGWRVDVNWTTLILLFGLATFGEFLEFGASAWGASRAGGSRRAAVLSLVGAMIGGFVGLFLGLPVPLIGSVLGVVLFAAIGATVGAITGERWAGQELGQGWKVGKAAFWGRLWGTFGKISIGSILIAVVALAVVTT